MKQKLILHPSNLLHKGTDYKNEEDIIPTRILRHGQLSDGESLERGV